MDKETFSKVWESFLPAHRRWASWRLRRNKHDVAEFLQDLALTAWTYAEARDVTDDDLRKLIFHWRKWLAKSYWRTVGRQPPKDDNRIDAVQCARSEVDALILRLDYEMAVKYALDEKHYGSANGAVAREYDRRLLELRAEDTECSLRNIGRRLQREFPALSNKDETYVCKRFVRLQQRMEMWRRGS